MTTLPSTTSNVGGNATKISDGWKGFELVGGILDKNITPSFLHSESKTTSLCIPRGFWSTHTVGYSK